MNFVHHSLSSRVLIFSKCIFILFLHHTLTLPLAALHLLLLRYTNLSELVRSKADRVKAMLMKLFITACAALAALGVAWGEGELPEESCETPDWHVADDEVKAFGLQLGDFEFYL